MNPERPSMKVVVHFQLGDEILVTGTSIEGQRGIGANSDPYKLIDEAAQKAKDMLVYVSTDAYLENLRT